MDDHGVDAREEAADSVPAEEPNDRAGVRASS